MATVTVGWVDFQTLSDYVKDHLQKSAAERLRPHWDSMIRQGQKAGYNEIVSAFAARGYSKAQIDQWDRGDEFQLDIGAWWALKRLGVVQADMLGQANLNALDRRKELWGSKKDEIPAVVLTIDGVAVTPEGTFGQPNFGPMDTSEDLFVMDTEDSRIGEATRF
jgi:hypothetical protein